MSDKTEQFCVVIGDIAESKSYSKHDREIIQQALIGEWRPAATQIPINGEFDFGLRISAGDEFEFVCRNAVDALLWISIFRLRIRALRVKPAVTIRASMAAGERFVSDSTSNPYGEDGPVFHRARAGMEFLKSQNEYLTFLTWPPPDAAKIHLINEILPLLDNIYHDWTSHQAEAILLAHKGISGEEIAATLGISSPAVSQRLANTYWEAYFRMIKIINRMLLDEIKVNDLNFKN